MVLEDAIATQLHSGGQETVVQHPGTIPRDQAPDLGLAAIIAGRISQVVDTPPALHTGLPAPMPRRWVMKPNGMHGVAAHTLLSASLRRRFRFL